MALPSPSYRTRLHIAGLKRRWWIIVALGVVVAVLVGLRDSQETKKYTATTTLLLGSSGSSASGLLNAASVTSYDAPNRTQATAVALIGSSSVTSLVMKQLHLTQDPSSDIDATVEPDSNLIQIAATNPSPAASARLANAYATQYETFIRDNNVSGLRSAIASLQSQLTTVKRSQRATIQASITSLVQQEATASGGVTVVDTAKVPITASSPKTHRDIAIGLLLGLALGIGLVLFLDGRDRLLREAATVEEAYGQPNLAMIPTRSRALGRGDSAQVLSDVSSEPFRIMRSGLGQLGSELSRVILVTSATAGEGKSLTALGLARAWAYTGRPVALVEADLRRPSFERYLPVSGSTGGVANLLRGRTQIADVAEHPVEDLPFLSVFPAGGTPARSAELLGGPRMHSLLTELSESHDVVILDAPPLLPVADARTLLDCDLVDVVVVVGRVGTLEREQAERARTIIASHGWSDFQLVVNGVTGRETLEQYGGQYGSIPEPDELASETVSLGRTLVPVAAEAGTRSAERRSSGPRPGDEPRSGDEPHFGDEPRSGNRQRSGNAADRKRRRRTPNDDAAASTPAEPTSRSVPTDPPRRAGRAIRAEEYGWKGRTGDARPDRLERTDAQSRDSRSSERNRGADSPDGPRRGSDPGDGDAGDRESRRP